MRNYFYLSISIFLILFACGEDATIKRGKALLETGDTTAAIQQFEAALKQNPSNAEAYYQLGLVYEGLGDTTESSNAFKSAAKLAPKRAEVRLALGRLYWHNGDRSGALAQFQNLLSDSPKKEILLQLAGLTGDAYHVQRLRTEGSDDYEQTFTEKGNIMTFTAKDNDDYSPAISPDGKWVAFASNRLQNAELYLIDLTDRSLRQLTHTDELDEYMPAFSPDGKSIVFVTERTRGGMMLPPVQASGSDPSRASIYLMDIDGRNQRPLVDAEGADRAPVFSPDGKKIAFESKAPTQEVASTPGSTENNDTLEIYVIDIDGSSKTQLTHNDVDDGHPTWSPNGKQIAFSSMVENIYQIFIVNAAGGAAKQLTFSDASHYHPIFSSDGKRILYVSNAHNHYTLWMMNIDGTHKTQLTNHIGAHFEPSLSQDGKKLVFSSDRSDHMRIYLMDLAQPVQKEALKARLAGF
ncbi:MAG: tetratricopeptide repeat protein [Candidatus Poribacteria bacterium]|nr:tetratricopeptide repeat protein [Candidatus Poribacteria bacterium]